MTSILYLGILLLLQRLLASQSSLYLCKRLSNDHKTRHNVSIKFRLVSDMSLCSSVKLQTLMFFFFFIFLSLSPQSCTSAPRRGKCSEDHSVFSFLFSCVLCVSGQLPYVFGSVKPEVLKNVCFCKSGIR